MEKFLEEGDECPEKGCSGHFEFKKVENCSCHLSAPCNACTDRPLACNECGKELVYERWNGYVMQSDKETSRIYASKLRDLDSSKVDWHSFSHSSCSMIKRGVYPEGVSSTEVRKLVDGTFGGRFSYFRDGKFEFIAYTD